MLCGAEWCKVMLSGAEWRWVVHSDAEWCWVLHSDAEWCRVVLGDAEWCDRLVQRLVKFSTMQLYTSQLNILRATIHDSNSGAR